MDEALYSATYVDNYIDSVENLPDDVQRHLSRIRDIDVQYRNLLRDVDHYYDLWRSLQNCSDVNSSRRARSVTRMQQSLIQAQELGDEKMQIVTQLQELIDHKTRQLDTDQKNLDIKEEKDNSMQLDDCEAPTPQKQSRTQSPLRGGGEGSLCSGNGSANGYGTANSVPHLVNAGGNSTPNSERSGNSNSQSLGNNSNGTSGNINISSNFEHQRSNSKRSRRRNDTAASNMEFCGNESNSANEAGSNGGDRNLSQKATNIAGASQKKGSGQSQAGSTSGGASLTVSGSGSGNGGSSAGTSSATGTGTNNTGKKKKRKARGTQSSQQQNNTREETPPPDPIDPDEPTYCVCNQISFGEMILCDNDLCPIEWFHFSCVSLVLKPKGKWYCPNCRGDRPNVMKPKAQFLKELERYNKEKEEKT